MDGKAGNQKGAELERRVSRIEFADGAIVRMRWPVVHQISGRRRTITDVDALVLDFDARLRPLLGIIECKSTRGQAGEQDRLLWLAGLRRFVGANRAVLVRESVTAAGRDLSRRLGVELLGLRELEQRELDHQWVPETLGVIGDGPDSEAMQKAEAQIKGIGDLPSGLVSFHRYDALVAEPHRVLGSLMSLGDITQAGTILPEPAGTIVAADALTALILAALR